MIPSSQGPLRVVSNAQMMEQERQAAIATAPREQLLSGLAAYVRKCWDAARNNKQSSSGGGSRSIEDTLLAALRARQGEYEPSKLAAIKEFGGSEVYARITSTKIRGSSAWIKDIYLNNSSEKPFTLTPTPNPDLERDYEAEMARQVEGEVAQMVASGEMVSPENVEMTVKAMMQQARDKARTEAKDAAARMEQKIQDQMIEGGAYGALSEFIDNLSTFKSAIFRAPVVRNRRVILWEGGVPTVKEVQRYEFENVSPFDFYPAPGIGHVDEGFVIQRHRLAPKDLFSLIGAPGYDEKAIRDVLDKFGTGGGNWLASLSDTTREQLENRNIWESFGDDAIDALEFSGAVQGKLLKEWGLQDGVEDDMAFYEANVWLIDRWVIKAQLNPDPLGRKGYFVTSIEKIPGSIWGNSIFDLIEDCQDICNASVRALVNNMGIASGPQCWVNVDRLPPGEKITQQYPWKVWPTTSDQMGSSAPPVEFFQPNSNAAELMATFEKFYQLADDISGIPRYMIGNEKIGGAGRTASGLSMLMDAANKLLKLTLANIDRDIIQPLVEMLFTYNMLYDPDPSIKGDVEVVARGAISLVQRETLQQRRNEFLQATANPVDINIVGPLGRATILREAAKGLDLPVDKIVPPPEALMQMQAEQQAAAQAQMNQPPAPPAQ